MTLRDADAATLGRVVSVTSDGSQADVEWHRRPGHEHETTTENAVALRHAHESELFDTP